MAKEKITVTMAAGVLAGVDADAREAGVSRSEYVERALEHEHYRRLLERVEGPSMTPDEERLAREALRWQNETVS